ncbi:general transcription factor IIF subunit 2-like [Ptychodera flava]|uniref:general transcription factor IIF subunit 2-like n=1 Tax=Ptychodera flava TaxID=63121 RepID=UPI003969E5F4
MADKHEVDLGHASRGVWLVKVPKFVSEQWSKADGKGEVGKLRISKGGPRREVTFHMNEELRKKGRDTDIPGEYKFILSSPGAQALSVFSESSAEASSSSASGSQNQEEEQQSSTKVVMEGKVVQRAECRPSGTDSYMKLKKTTIELAHKPARSVRQLERAVTTTYKPVKDHKSNVDYEKKKKENYKRSRGEKDQVMDMLFKAFERHQYYNIRDLQILTQQPITYLKEILKEIGVYNMKAPHKNMWELKPEYRHYDQAGKE